SAPTSARSRRRKRSRKSRCRSTHDTTASAFCRVAGLAAPGRHGPAGHSPEPVVVAGLRRGRMADPSAHFSGPRSPRYGTGDAVLAAGGPAVPVALSAVLAGTVRAARAEAAGRLRPDARRSHDGGWHLLPALSRRTGVPGA